MIVLAQEDSAATEEIPAPATTARRTRTAATGAAPVRRRRPTA